MGSRFGRNQKREARIEADTLRYSVGEARRKYDQALAYAQSEADALRLLASHVRMWMEDIERLLGRNAAASPVVERDVVRVLEEFRQRPAGRTDDPYLGPAMRTASFDPLDPRSADFTVTIERMHVLEAALERDKEQQRTYMKLILVDQGQRWAYAVSDSYMRQRQLGPRDVHEIGRYFAEQLVRQCNDYFRGPRAA